MKERKKPASAAIHKADTAPGQLDKRLAIAPIIDKYPTIIGQNLSLTYLSSAFRLCNTGIRWQYVDALAELLEHDPHARGVVRQRVLAVAGGRIEVHPAELPAGEKGAEHPEAKQAKIIADEVRRQIMALPRRAQSIAALSWGLITGVSAAENMWDRNERGWEIRGLSFIHSRRLSFSNPATWDLHVWDQGLVGPGLTYMGPTTGVFGLRMADFPGKFIIHTPQLSGDYPTRDGEGRYIAFYMALKRTIVRASAMDFERTIRPWVVGYFSREETTDEKTPATDDDIKQLNAACKALGLGSLNGAVLPDSCKVELIRAASEQNAQDFVQWIDGQISKAMLGQTFTTESQRNGNRSTAEVAKRGTLEVSRYDAQCLSDTLEECLVSWIVRLNFGDDAMHLLPSLRIVVDELPDAKSLLALAKTGTEIGMEIDADHLGKLSGLQLVPNETKKPRVTKLMGAAHEGGGLADGGEISQGFNGENDDSDAEDGAARASAKKQSAARAAARTT